MRRWTMTPFLATFVLGGVGASVTPAGAQAAPAAFCQARSDVSASLAREDDAATQSAVDALAASAPAEVQEAAATLAELTAKRGLSALDTKKGSKAADAIDEYVLANCALPVLAVSGIDYEFEGISSPVTAGMYVVEFTDDAKKEDHELVLLRPKPGVDLAVKKLLALSENRRVRKADVVGAVYAQPGDTEKLLVFLEPGRYVYACFIDVGTTSGDEHGDDGHGGDEHAGAENPHWKKGMRGELEVIGPPGG